jgi:ferredoxin/coenzyme F420-reducing hydrogenase delta subunit
VLERALLRLLRPFRRGLPERLDPLAHAGALAVASFLISLVSGVLLLLWYSPSVHGAHGSLAGLDESLSTGGVIRAVHRYASDACIVFALLHGGRVLVGRRLGGGRNLAWISGVSLLALIGLVGWLGYWLVWDVSARQVALGSAKLVDALPIFVDPLERTFLVDESVSSLLFVLVFFVHIFLPLILGAVLWFHVSRVARPRMLPPREIWVALLAGLVVLSVLFAAPLGEPARMLETPGRITIDAWFLWPLWVTDRLGAGVLWAVLLGLFAFFSALPWLLRLTRRPVVAVEESRCNGCERCVEDCPYLAMNLKARDGESGLVAEVDPDRCVGCGVCIGACERSALDVAPLESLVLRRKVAGWIATDRAEGRAARIAFVCERSAGGDLATDSAQGFAARLPGWRLVKVPCAGWISPLTLAHVTRGEAEAVVVRCSGLDCSSREGGVWTQARLQGTREPALKERLRDRVRVLAFDRGEGRRLEAGLRVLSAGGDPAARPRTRRRAIVASGALVLAIGFIVLGGSHVPYAPPQPSEPELVVTFKLSGATGDSCVPIPTKVLETTPIHMRREEVCDRRRKPVRLWVAIDDEPILTEAYAPRGLRGTGQSIAIARVPMVPGRHHVAVAIDDGIEGGEWRHRDARDVAVDPGQRLVVRFDRDVGFRWFE